MDHISRTSLDTASATRRGRDRLEARPAGNMPGSLQGDARWATIAAAMHAAHAVKIDARATRSDDQRAARAEARRLRKGA